MKTAALLLLLLTQDKKADDVLFEKDLVYGKGGGEDLKLNLGRPKDAAGPLPCIVIIHGGGWTAGSKEGHNVQVMDLAKKGYVAATVGYRFAPKHVFPAQIEDVKCAVRFLRANAEKYGIDKDRIGALGFSAGAHLSMLLGSMDKDDGLEGEGGNPEQSSKVNAVVAWFGPTDMTTNDWPKNVIGLISNLVGGPKEEKVEACRKASPLFYVNAGDAPMLLIHGTKDRLVPWSQATAMADALSKAGVYGRVDLIVGADHGWGGPELQRTVDETQAFFVERLKARK